jgi:hypothetical protein
MSKTLSEYRSTLGEVLRYEPTSEFTKKLLTALGLEWREEVKWSLPLRLRDNEHDYGGLGYSVTDADDAHVLFLGETGGGELEAFKRILTAANAELSRQHPATPLFWRQGDNPK